MSDNVTNELLYETLKAIQSDLGGMRITLDEHSNRLSSVDLRIADLAGQVAQTNIRLDRHEERLTRIERNLDLVRG